MAQVGPPTQGFVKIAGNFEPTVFENPKIPERFFRLSPNGFQKAEMSRCLGLKLTFSTQTQDFALRGHLKTMLEESASHHKITEYTVMVCIIRAKI